MIRVRVVKDELRHLMMARNRLAWYMHSEPSYMPEVAVPPPPDVTDMEDLVEDQLSFVEGPILPEPIDNDFACCKCFEVEGCMLYRKVDNYLISSLCPSHPANFMFMLGG